ncbi:cyclic nucleotide-gated ion channel [Striga asiatica]|uniref:Cyclic nucleotide-gated ion channel n=1 Tax=Striga asiatica TaxID=4170 RepID=A0A5A7PD36_STRAF|nr:cyclic nucleotide-gated ion channel [Striga asiatica]
MPPQNTDLQFSISRWFGLRRRDSVRPDNGVDGDDNQFSFSGGECHVCTQVGVPVFHSTSCDNTDQPEWEASAGSSLLPIKNRIGRPKAGSGGDGRRPPILDPRTKRVQRWNRAFLLARGMALAVDPLFFYALSIGRGGSPCLYMDGGLAAVVTVLRTCLDAVHLCHLWLQFKLAYVSRESLVVGCGKLVWDPRAIAAHYLRSVKGFWFDVFVILPVPQAVFWLILPKLIREEQIKLIMTILLIIFMFQFLPKVYHSIYLMRRMQKVTGYIFGTIWWGFGLNLIAYFIASHVAGGCWYVLAIQRVASCLKQQCALNGSCNLSLSCSEEVCYQFLLPSDTLGNPCGGNSTVLVRKPMCLDVNGPFRYGIYKWALPVVSSNSVAVKILYPIFWGLMTLSTFGNDLEPTSNWLEVMFSISTVLSGLLLFTLLIGVSACGDGQEKENATENPRHGVVDETKTASFTTEAQKADRRLLSGRAPPPRFCKPPQRLHSPSPETDATKDAPAETNHRLCRSAVVTDASIPSAGVGVCSSPQQLNPPPPTQVLRHGDTSPVRDGEGIVIWGLFGHSPTGHDRRLLVVAVVTGGVVLRRQAAARQRFRRPDLAVYWGDI